MLVLVVDHDPATLAQTARSMEGAGWDVEATTSFTDARRLLADRPDAVITDLRLGEYNGLHLAMLAKSADPDVYVIVTGDHGDASSQHDAEAFEATFVSKPCTGRELTTMIAAHASPRPAVWHSSGHQHLHVH